MDANEVAEVIVESKENILNNLRRWCMLCLCQIFDLLTSSSSILHAILVAAAVGCTAKKKTVF
jgi:hypothetical protein